MTTTFYSHKEDNYFLSNFYPHGTSEKLTILYNNEIWKTSEHIYQALKFCNETEYEKEWRNIIRTSNTPTIAKYLGHQFTYTKYKWQHKYRDLVLYYKDKVRHAGDLNTSDFKTNIMVLACSSKYTSSEKLKNLLCETTGILGENSGGMWGIHGSNILGQILMLLREEFIKENTKIT